MSVRDRAACVYECLTMLVIGSYFIGAHRDCCGPFLH